MKKILLIGIIICASVFGSIAVKAMEGTLTKTQIQSIVSGEPKLGNSRATVTIVEYSDMECPYCIRHHKETLPLIRKTFPTAVNFVYKNNRGVNHTGTEAKAIAVLCVKKYAPGAYFQAVNRIFGQSSYTTGKLFDIKNLKGLVNLIAKAKQKTFTSCMTNKETINTLDKETLEAEQFNLSGTPGFLIVNNTTGKYTTIEGAYPFKTFKDTINILLKK